MGTSQLTVGCWSLLDISQELARVCWSLLEALERYLEVAGAYWRFLEALEQALCPNSSRARGTQSATRNITWRETPEADWLSSYLDLFFNL